MGPSGTAHGAMPSSSSRKRQFRRMSDGESVAMDGSAEGRGADTACASGAAMSGAVVAAAAADKGAARAAISGMGLATNSARAEFVSARTARIERSVVMVFIGLKTS